MAKTNTGRGRNSLPGLQSTENTVQAWGDATGQANPSAGYGNGGSPVPGGQGVGARGGLDTDGLTAQRDIRQQNLDNIRSSGSSSSGPTFGWDPRAQRPGIAANTSYQEQMRARQQALIDRLHGIATGQTKSPAQELFEQQVGQVQNQNIGTSASLRDVGPGGQQAIAAQNRDSIQGQGIEQGAILQLQQKQQAESALAQLYEQQRQGDIANAGILSEQELTNRRLDDSRNLSEIERLYGVDVRNTNQQQNVANARLGFGIADDQSYKDKVGAIAQGGAAAFGYLQQAGAGNSTPQKTGATLEDMNKPNYGWGGPGA